LKSVFNQYQRSLEARRQVTKYLMMGVGFATIVLIVGLL
jgi:hypothetical protein